jgi:hypothetical protein
VCDTSGHVFALPRSNCYVKEVVELAPEGRRLAVWGGNMADGHMISIGPDGNTHVVDRDAHEIVVFDRVGRRISGLGQRHHLDTPSATWPLLRPATSIRPMATAPAACIASVQRGPDSYLGPANVLA